MQYAAVTHQKFPDRSIAQDEIHCTFPKLIIFCASATRISLHSRLLRGLCREVEILSPGILLCCTLAFRFGCTSLDALQTASQDSIRSTCTALRERAECGRVSSTSLTFCHASGTCSVIPFPGSCSIDITSLPSRLPSQVDLDGLRGWQAGQSNPSRLYRTANVVLSRTLSLTAGGPRNA